MLGSIAVRHAVEGGAARLRAGVLHWHHAFARTAADEHPRANNDRLLVADDDARVLRGEVGARAVGPDDRVSRENPAPSIVAGDVVALPGAFLRHRRAGTPDRDD